MFKVSYLSKCDDFVCATIEITDGVVKTELEFVMHQSSNVFETEETIITPALKIHHTYKTFKRGGPEKHYADFMKALKNHENYEYMFMDENLEEIYWKFSSSSDGFLSIKAATQEQTVVSVKLLVNDDVMTEMEKLAV